MPSSPKYLVLLMLLIFAPASSYATDAEPEYFWQSVSEAQGFIVTVYPRDGKVPLHAFHEWVVTIKDRQGNPVHHATLQLAAGMPGHGHGMPSAPEVTRYLQNGEYLIEGMKFNMMGSWIIRVQVKTPELTDDASFQIDLAY